MPDLPSATGLDAFCGGFQALCGLSLTVGEGEGPSAVIVEQDVAGALSVSSRLYCLQECRVTLAGTSADTTHDAIARAYFGSAA